MEEQQLSNQDQARVNQYLASSIHQVERQPFRPGVLMGVVIAVVTGLSGLSLLIAYLSGIS